MTVTAPPPLPASPPVFDFSSLHVKLQCLAAPPTPTPTAEIQDSVTVVGSLTRKKSLVIGS